MDIDQLYLYDPEFEPSAKNFKSEVGAAGVIYPVSKWDDVKIAVSMYSSVKLLIFNTHGLPGKVDLPDHSGGDSYSFRTLSTGSNFLTNEARILLMGCEIGNGSTGDYFLDEIGRSLLKGKGGIVGATTVENMTFQLGPFSTEEYMVPLSFGRLKVRRYDTSGAQIGSRTVDRRGWKR
jgi:hypothetical protein